MNSRLQQFLSAENISQSQLADSLGVARASISHILSGRNKPGYDFIEALMRHYPALNIEWLISGRGKMYVGRSESGNSGSAASFNTLEDENQIVDTELTSNQNRHTKSISRIVVFYSDGTFREIE